MDSGIEERDITLPAKVRLAKGGPGGKPTWSSGAKTLVGTAASQRSRIWFTVGQGTLNEIYFPDVDQANTKSVRFLVTGDEGFFSDEACDAEHKVISEPGIPCCRIESFCKSGRYRLVKEIITDPVRDALMVRVQFAPLDATGLKLHLFIDAHVGDMGSNNDAWIGRYKVRPVLLAQRKHISLAVASSAPMLKTSCGYVGMSDGYTLLSKGKKLTDANMARNGNIALTAQLDYGAGNEENNPDEHNRFVFSLACGTNAAEAAQQANAGLLQNFDKAHDLYVYQWQRQQADYAEIQDLSGSPRDMYRVSTGVLETHQSKRFPGGFIASLSSPWGFAHGDKDIGGYHVLWPRDMVETAMGKLASGDARSARSTLFYLHSVQDNDGGWSQNMWLDGTPHWGAVQMDGIALPVLLANQLRRENSLDEYDVMPMVRDAIRYLLARGPYTGQGRWEALSGYSPYTMATEVAALLAAADFLDECADHACAEFLRTTADAWQDTVDEFTYVTGTSLASTHGVEGYYIRMAPPKRVEAKSIDGLQDGMTNLPPAYRKQRASDIVSPDALALVRFGLRAASDARILNTIKVVDATLKRETSTGPVWIRSSHDGYGEQADGKPFLKTGIGRGWPLLGGERGHYEIAGGNREFALDLLKTMARQTSECGMIPEQIWDMPDIPEHMLFNGHPTGSGMPLVWAHSEYIKLLRSLHANAVWDMPLQTVQRYQVEQREAAFQIWTPTQKRGWLAPNKALRIDLPAPATIHWQAGKSSGTLRTESPGFDLHCANLPMEAMGSATRINFHIQPDKKHCELKEQNFFVRRTRKV